MSQGAGLSRQEKKAQRDAERRNHGKKRKLAETIDQEETRGGADAAGDAQAVGALKHDNSADDNREPDDLAAAAQVGNEDVGADNAGAAPKKRRKVANAGTDTTAADGTTPALSKSRFILFIGNLPFSATDASLQAHFQKLAPFTLRHRTDPKTKKSKGFAFLEFENYDRMKTCLKLYHHSIFDPDAKENGGSGKGNGKGGRRINVELTAGGGGKAENRKEKIKAKNFRLEEQRKRRAEVERKEKIRKERKEGRTAADKPPQDSALQDAEDAVGANDADGIHPSRRARVRV